MNLSKTLPRPAGIFTALLLVFCLNAFAQQRERDHLIMFDVTGSMVGRGDGRGIDIFDNVKGYAKRYINDVKIGEILAIYPFEGKLKTGPGEYFIGQINSEEDREKAKRFLDNLRADGQRTWLTISYESALNQLERFWEFIPNYDTKTREQIILLYTDGKGNHIPTDQNIENFIEKFKLARNDFEHLYTKFIIIGEAGVAYNTDDLAKKREAGIEVVTSGRLDDIIQISVKPTTVNLSNHETNVKLQFDNVPASFLGRTVALGVSLRNEPYCLIDLNPNTIKLSNTSFDVIAILNETSACLERLFETDLIEGSFSFSADTTNIDFTTVTFSYRIINDKIGFSLAEKEEAIIIDKGSLVLKVTGNENLKEERIIFMNLKGLDPDGPALIAAPISFEIDKDTRNIKINLKPENRKEYKAFSRGMKENLSKQLNFEFIMAESSPFESIDDDLGLVSITHITKKRLPVWVHYLVIGLIIGLLILFAVLKLITAKFPENSRIEDDEGRICGYLKPKFGKSYLSVGNSTKDDIKIEGAGLKQSCKIYPHSYNTIRVRKSNPGIKLFDKSGEENNLVFVEADDSFSLKDETSQKTLFFII